MNKRDEATQRYQDKNMRKILLKINRKTEPEILEQIEKQENMQGYIKRLILEDSKISVRYETPWIQYRMSADGWTHRENG